MVAEKEKDRSIRFITPSYDELFRIPDGATIKVTYPDRESIQKCRYIDDYHLYVGRTVYHICEFAEIVKRNKGACVPEEEIQADETAWEIGSNYLTIQKSDEGWDYTLYDRNYNGIDGGRLDKRCGMLEAREEILKMHGMEFRTRYKKDPGDVEMMVANAENQKIDAVKKSARHNEKRSPKKRIR